MSSGKIIIPIIAVITQLHKCHITTCNFEIVASMRSNPFFVCLCSPLGPFPGERDARGFTLSAWRRPFNEQSTVDSSMKKSTYRKANLALARWISKTIHSIRSTTIWSRFVCTHRSIQSEQDKKKACAVLISSLQLHFYFYFFCLVVLVFAFSTFWGELVFATRVANEHESFNGIIFNRQQQQQQQMMMMMPKQGVPTIYFFILFFEYRHSLDNKVNIWDT